MGALMDYFEHLWPLLEGAMIFIIELFYMSPIVITQIKGKPPRYFHVGLYFLWGLVILGWFLHVIFDIQL